MRWEISQSIEFFIDDNGLILGKVLPCVHSEYPAGTCFVFDVQNTFLGAYTTRAEAKKALEQYKENCKY